VSPAYQVVGKMSLIYSTTPDPQHLTLKGWLSIDFDAEVVLERKLGEGGFGCVWAARWKGELIAVKLVPVMSLAHHPHHHHQPAATAVAAAAGPSAAAPVPAAAAPDLSAEADSSSVLLPSSAPPHTDQAAAAHKEGSAVGSTPRHQTPQTPLLPAAVALYISSHISASSVRAIRQEIK